MEQRINLNLSVKETELILNALAKFPYNEVSAIIATISGQAKAQLEPLPEPKQLELPLDNPNLESVN